jgi:hypothetical protein
VTGVRDPDSEGSGDVVRLGSRIRSVKALRAGSRLQVCTDRI